MNNSLYTKYLKRFLDITISFFAIIIFSWLFIIITILIYIKLGKPIIFIQMRPGLNEKIFRMYKFRTMTEEKDLYGNLLPDEDRLTKLGKFLRKSSLDELPELFNILKGEMSVVGPRPQLVRDMVFMSEDFRKRHNVKPGLTGLAQISGRNIISWDSKFNYDIKYIHKITFYDDIKIILKTLIKVIKSEGIEQKNMATAEDYGDYLLRNNLITVDFYTRKQKEAIEIINNYVKDEKNG